MGTTMKIILVLAITGLLSLQQLSILGNVFDGSVNNIANLVFALVSKPITQRLEYAHFLPLTNSTKLHQVKVIVDYAPISLGKYAYMKVYGPNRALLKISSSPRGVDTIAPGRAEFATTISDGTIKQVSAYIMFTDSFRNANYSNPISINLNLGQTLQPPTIKSHVSTH
ncbi:MAG TPA: hypothetical protein VH500_18175 [Nitrososphaeraceae archaeon]